MARMKTFLIYLLLFVGFYIASQFLIDAYIKTSYYKIKTYDISEDQLTITILSAKASKDDGYIEGKISNGTKEKSSDKYMKVELYSEKNVNLGEEYVKIDAMNPSDIKDFKIRFTCDYVKSFKITFLTPEEKAQIDANKDTSLIPGIEVNKDAERIVDMVDPKNK